MIMEAYRKKYSGKVTWQSPSNIALVKYWGKKPGQIPANASLSMTLSRAVTETSLEFSDKFNVSEEIDLEFWFDGGKNPAFEQKIYSYLLSLLPQFPVLGQLQLVIRSRNTFPHSAGIASSASSMSALGLCLVSLMELIGGKHLAPSALLREASRLSRLASGSACRSIYGGFTVWGKHPQVPGSSDEYAIELPFKVDEAFEDLRDAILVVSHKEKPVSSRAGHSLMNDHPFASKRYDIAGGHVTGLIGALREGDLERFVEITESEALMLHALMMTSAPSFLLIEPNTISIINATRRFRKDTGIPVCFTLDAGPNVHLLYPGRDSSKVKEWIELEIKKYCQDGFWIDDGIGQGPQMIESEV